MDSKIRQFVYRVRSRIREQLVIDNLIKAVGIGMLVALIISLIALMIPFYYAIVFATTILMLAFLVGIIWGIRKTPNPMQSALLADSKGHKEKISTAFYLSGKEDAFSMLQKKDAMRIVEQFQIRKEFPIRVEWKRVAGMLILTLVFVITSLIETPAKREALVKHDVKQEAKEEIARLEKVEKELEKNPELAKNEVAEVKEQLENAKKELKEAESYEELSKAKERINKKMEMASKDVKDQTLAEMMKKAAQEGEKLAKEKEQELAKKAKEALEKAADGNEKDKEKAYEELKKLAEMTGDEQLAQAAETYKNATYSDNAYANASNALSQTTQKMQNSDYAQNNNSSNNQSNSQNSRQNNNASNQNQNNQGQGNGNQSQSGNNQGKGSVQGQGNGSGGGNGSGNGNGGGWNYGGRNGGEGERNTNEDITIPNGEVGNDDNLTGKANGNDSSTKSKSNQSQTWSGNKVGYNEVSGKYKEKAYKKVNGSNYPSDMKERIKNYFDGLN